MFEEWGGECVFDVGGGGGGGGGRHGRGRGILDFRVWILDLAGWTERDRLSGAPSVNTPRVGRQIGRKR